MAKGTGNKGKKSTNTVVETTPTQVVEKAAAVTTVDDTKVEDETTAWSTQSSEFLSKIQSLASALSSLKTEFKSLDKSVSKQLKNAARMGAKRKRKCGNRQPSGFVKPTLISDELAAFLSKDKGSEMARTEVTREINKYIRANDLQDKDNGRRILPDAKLSKLLKLTKKDELTYFNLQRYMSPHFAKNGATSPPVTASN